MSMTRSEFETQPELPTYRAVVREDVLAELAAALDLDSTQRRLLDAVHLGLRGPVLAEDVGVVDSIYLERSFEAHTGISVFEAAARVDRLLAHRLATHPLGPSDP